MLPALEPHDAETAAAMLANAAADGISVVPHGARTKLGVVALSDRCAALSTHRLTSGLSHYAGDLVATVPAGSTLRDVNAALMLERQWIPLDPPFDERATIGGVVSANDSGPRRHRFGSPRDLIIGIEVALTNGRVAHSGGRVVKNVAGYDLARLFCGSRGSLGLITGVTFKLAPTPAASRTVISRFDRASQAAAEALALSMDAGLTPSAVELIAPEPRLLVRFESTARSADHMAERAAAHLAERGSTEVAVLDDRSEARVWAEHRQMESQDEGLICQVSTLPTTVGGVVDDVERLAAEVGVPWSVTARAAMGLLRVRVLGDPDGVRRYAELLRACIGPRGGHVQFAGQTALLGGQFDPWGAVGSAAAVGRAVKHRFDPKGVLPYPWGLS
jgi:glycolate oxidase FAD binding subunit